MIADRESRVRQRAHEIWQAEGCPEGRAEEHWAQAERDIAAAAAPKPKAAAKSAPPAKKPAAKAEAPAATKPKRTAKAKAPA